MQTRTKIQKRNRVFAALLFLPCLIQTAATAADSSAPAKKAVPVALGYYDSRTVSCNWGNHCRDDLGPVEAEFLKYLDDGKKTIASAAASETSADDLQKQVDNYRVGLQAREALYGTCPGRCLSYDFPVDLRNSCKVVMRSSRVDLLIDIPSIYYGAEKVLKSNDQTSKIAEELKRQTARYR
jgi:hypothetical protein